MKTLALTVTVCALLAQSQEIRIDTFDTRSNRAGYIVVNPNTGRLDQFDSRSNRTGFGTVTSPSTGGTRIDTYSNNGTRVWQRDDDRDETMMTDADGSC